MKKRILAFTFAAAALAIASNATTPANANWTGVWQSTLDGQPWLELTLAADAGTVDGTIVFHAVAKKNGVAKAISTEPHTLIHPHLDGNMLSFQVIRGNGSGEVLNMNVELAKDGNAEFRCTNCGDKGTEAQLERTR